MVYYSREVEKNHIYYFLARLNSKYDSIRVQKDPLPSLNEVFLYVQEEDYRHTMLN